MKVDIVIIGGGIAGLWAVHTLRQAGFQAILLETQALGHGQTIQAQGIIHGGLKYALQGILTPAAQAISAMPKRWNDCLKGQGTLDLTAVKTLSPAQYLWSTDSITSKVANFFASKALRGRVAHIKQRKDYPLFLQNPSFQGHVYRLEEKVLDIPSVLKALATPVQDALLKIQDLRFTHAADGRIDSLNIQYQDQHLNIEAQTYCLMAGQGNQSLLDQVGYPHLKMQRRPLHMIYAVLPENKPEYAFFGHCLDAQKNPRITLSSHTTSHQQALWYIGGHIAETGVERSPEAQILCAQQELYALFPWFEDVLKAAHWHTFRVDRAEPAQQGLLRPDTAFISQYKNILVGWPTKLALAPVLTDQILEKLTQQAVSPTAPIWSRPIDWPIPPYASPVWDTI